MSARRSWAAAAVLAAALAAPGGAARAPEPATPRAEVVPSGKAVSFRAGPVRLRRARLARAEWWGGPTTAASGETVRVYVSTSYPQDDAFARAWADYLAALVHGDELGRVAVHVAPPSEVAGLCGERALGCYGGGRMVVPGDAGAGVDPYVVAAHEYGHHVAASRDNAPWRALDWGTKRWASSVGVCAGTRAGSFSPGDADGRYRLNPGEGFAEAYRELNERRGVTAPFGWTLVDASFVPDDRALAAIEADVATPWAGPTSATLRGRIGAAGPRVWRRTIATPLDGDLDVRVLLPRAAAYEVELLSGDGRTRLARGLWSGAAEKSLRHTVCGERAVVLRVTRSGPPGAIRADLRRP